jgi:hypothetical protein
MEKTYKNEALLELTRGSYYIHDSSVSRLDIYQSDQLNINIYFNSIVKHAKQLKIHFSGIIRYQFLYNDSHHFYNVERYKFFKTEDGFYLSLDPFDESEEISENDEDLILCTNIEGHFI